MNNTIKTGQQAIDSTTPENLTGVGGNNSVIRVKSLKTNTGIIYVGDSTVSTGTGYPLDPGESLELEMQSMRKVYFLATVDEEKIAWEALSA